MSKLLLCSLILLLCVGPTRAAEEEEEEEGAANSMAYVSLGDAMVLNLSSSSNRLTFLQFNADILINDENSEEIIKAHIPAIRHSLIVLLSEQKASDIKTPGKREEIRKQATSQIQALIADLSGNKDIEDVLFSSILVQ
jgi:flagellar FliL protein